MNKKAFVFTIIVIALLMLLASTYSLYSVVKSREAINKRVDTLNSYVDSAEKDLPRELYISGFRIIFLLESKIVDNGAYINNFDSAFKEAFYNGTFGGVTEPIMNGARFRDIIQSERNIASKINADLNITSYTLTINQEDPWNVKISMTGNLIIRDNSGLALWNKTTQIIAKIPINNFEDPLYLMSTSGLVKNKINKTVYSNFVSGNDVTNLTLQLENSYYIASPGAPSFLDRLEGNLSGGNQNGIESLVYLPKLSAQGIALKDKSCVDYIYFSSSSPAPYKITGMYGWFKLDDPHLDVYGARGLMIP